MTLPKATVRTVCLAALALCASASQAAITEYSSLATFQSAVLVTGTDSFNDLTRGVVLPGPLNRTAGAFGYVANATVTDAGGNFANPFYNVGSAADTWLSTDSALATIRFTGFGANVNAIGGAFFPTSLAGVVTPASVTLVATDLAGSVTRTLVNTSESSFWGFVSNTTLVSLTMVAVNSTGTTTTNFFPAVNNLVLASAVPEPQTWALLMAGVLALGALRRRQG